MADRGAVTYDARLGTLRLDGGRLSFGETGRKWRHRHRVADIGGVTFPANNVGSVVRIDAGADRYRLAFCASVDRFKGRAPDARRRPARRWGQDGRPRRGASSAASTRRGTTSPAMTTVELNGTGLAPADVVAVARGDGRVQLGARGREAMERSAPRCSGR